MTHQDDQALVSALTQAREAGRVCALATIVSTRGSTPRKVGARMLVDPATGLVGTVGGGGSLHLGGGEQAVEPGGDHQDRRRHSLRTGRAEHHVEIGRVRLVLEAGEVAGELGRRHVVPEQVFPGPVRGAHHGPEMHRQVRLQEGKGVPAGDPQGHPERAAGGDRSDEHRSRHVVVLQVALHDEAAHRVPDEDRRLADSLDGGGEIGGVVIDPDSPQRPVAGCVAVPPQIHGVCRVPPGGEPREYVVLPAPGTVPGPVDEQEGSTPDGAAGEVGVEDGVHRAQPTRRPPPTAGSDHSSRNRSILS